MLSFPTMGLERQPIRAFIGVPEGYKRTVLREANSLVREMDPCGVNCSKVEHGNRDRWKEITGLDPEASRFTIIVPIHNEERYLPAALSSLAVSDIPSSAHVNFVFVTNNSTDKSSEIVGQFMESFGPVMISTFGAEELERLKDSGLNPLRSTTQFGNMTLTHIDTTTIGKANALNLGNTLALQNGDRIGICVDANNFLEPDAIAHLYGSAYRQIEQEADGTALITGVHKSEMLPRKMLKVVKRIQDKAPDKTISPDIRVSGCLMAWDTNLLGDIGGLPPGALVDYGFGVSVREKGRTVKKDEEAIIWGYEPNNLPERMKQYIRVARGKFQIMARNPQAEAIVRTDHPQFSKKFLGRSLCIGRDMINNPEKSPYIFLKSLMQESARYIGKREYKRDPFNPTWPPLYSTKGKPRVRKGLRWCRG